MLKINNGNKYIRLKKYKLSVVDKKIILLISIIRKLLVKYLVIEKIVTKRPPQTDMNL